MQALLRTEFKALGIDLPPAGAFAAFAAQDRYSEGERGRAEALDQCRRYVADAEIAMRPLFNLWPRALAEVRPIQPEQEGSQHSHYVPPQAERDRPAYFG